MNLKATLIILLFAATNDVFSLGLRKNDFSSSDTTKNFVEDKLLLMQMSKARTAFVEYEYYKALDMYEELYGGNKNSALLNLRIAECHHALKQYDKAKIYAEAAKELNPNVHEDLFFLSGQIYHRLGDINAARENFKKYLPLTKKRSDERKDTERFLKQLDVAEDLLKKPVDVEIKALGTNVNSPYDDYAPSVSADGSMMIFTSRRTDTKGRGTDPYDKKFYEDIYISMWDSVKNEWGLAEHVPGRINTEFHDASLSISPDGGTIYIYRNIPGETQSGDIYFSNYKNERWGSPKPMPKPINTSYFESSASLSADGKYMYFVSERASGYGRGDIYRSKKISKNEWGVPENLGAVVNSEHDEISVFIHPDGKTLFFSSERETSMGGYDIFKTVYNKGKWSTPENLGYPINSFEDDLHFVLTIDNKTAYFSSVREKEGVGGRDIFMADMSKYPIHISEEERAKEKELAAKSGEDKIASNLSILKGKVLDSDAAQSMEVELSFYNNAGEKIGSTYSSIEGEYFITLPGNEDYKVEIKQKGYLDFSEEFNLPLGEGQTFIKAKNYIINRVPVEPRKRK